MSTCICTKEHWRGDANCILSYSGNELAQGFQRLPNKRFLPDYFEVIKTPIAFSTVRVCCL